MKQLDTYTLLEVISYIESQINNFPRVYREQGMFVPEEISTGYTMGLVDLKDYLQSYIENQVNIIENQ